MKILPGIFLLLMMLISPSLTWAADEPSAGSSSEASADQAQSDKEKKKKAKKAKGASGDEEPECD